MGEATLSMIAPSFSRMVCIQTAHLNRLLDRSVIQQMVQQDQKILKLK